MTCKGNVGLTTNIKWRIRKLQFDLFLMNHSEGKLWETIALADSSSSEILTQWFKTLKCQWEIENRHLKIAVIVYSNIKLRFNDGLVVAQPRCFVEIVFKNFSTWFYAFQVIEEHRNCDIIRGYNRVDLVLNEDGYLRIHPMERIDSSIFWRERLVRFHQFVLVSWVFTETIV